MSVDTIECCLCKTELEEAITCLQLGGVVAHACEGVWGLACNPYDKIAVQRVLDLKNRDVSKGLLVIGGTAAVFEEELCRLSTRQRQIVEMSWPGPSSWIVVTDRYPDWITGDKGSVGVRVPGHRQARGGQPHPGASPPKRDPHRDLLCLRSRTDREGSVDSLSPEPPGF